MEEWKIKLAEISKVMRDEHIAKIQNAKEKN